MITTRRHGTPAVVVTILIALMLEILPAPEWGQAISPQWPLLVMLYWVLALPHRIGIFSAWLVGLTVDVLGGTLLGEHALGYALASYVVLRLHRQLRPFPAWQQAILLLGLLLLQQLVSLWVMGITGREPSNLITYFMPSLIGTLLWPWLFALLRFVRRRFAVS